MDNITVITLNANDEQTETVLTVDELIYAWQHDIDIPTNDDTVVSCVLSETQLYFETFGELMEALTGSDRKDGWWIMLKAINIKNNVEIISGGAGLIFTILSFLILKKNDKKFRDSKEYIPIVTRIIVSSGNEINL